MRCPSCGAEVGTEDIFCGECGSPQAQKRRRLTRPLLIIVLLGVLVLGVVCLGGLAVALWSRPTPSVLFEDDFSNPRSRWEDAEWPDGSAVGYEDGAYSVVAVGDGWALGVAKRSLDDLIVAWMSHRCPGRPTTTALV